MHSSLRLERPGCRAILPGWMCARARHCGTTNCIGSFLTISFMSMNSFALKRKEGTEAPLYSSSRKNRIGVESPSEIF